MSLSPPHDPIHSTLLYPSTRIQFLQLSFYISPSLILFIPFPPIPLSEVLFVPLVARMTVMGGSVMALKGEVIKKTENPSTGSELRTIREAVPPHLRIAYFMCVRVRARLTWFERSSWSNEHEPIIYFPAFTLLGNLLATPSRSSFL